MNKIEAQLDKDYYHDADNMNYQIDGKWLDEWLDELEPGRGINGLITTLTFHLFGPKEQELVWHRILPLENETFICPLLMCPDDRDFYCTLVLAEIENTGKTIKWKRLGLDISKEYYIDKIGNETDWFTNVGPMEFNIEEYKEMIKAFREYFEVEQKECEEYNKKRREELKNKKSETVLNQNPQIEELVPEKSLFKRFLHWIKRSF